jgi:capsular exopolysaccharide synthesis family protein
MVPKHLSSWSREQYHSLAATLHNAQARDGVKTILIASAVAGEGKTLTAANLALTFSEAWQRRVLLIDADLRRPSLHRLFRLHELTGLHDDMPRPLTRPGQHVRRVSGRLHVLTAGRPSATPMAELTSDRMRHVLEEARQSYDWIILDTPPLTLLADASLLVSLVDGAVLVVKAESTSLEQARRALQTIGKPKTIGVVLNASKRQTHVRDEDLEYYNRIAPADIRDIRDIHDVRDIHDLHDIHDVHGANAMRERRDGHDVPDLRDVHDVRNRHDMRDMRDARDMRGEEVLR